MFESEKAVIDGTFTYWTQMLLEPGHVIDGKYRLVRIIGTGGMGAVYEGENTLIRRRVAIKVLHAANTNNADSVRRFEREAQAAGQIGNDHILEIIDLGSLPNGDRYLVMEYLDGETLAERIERFGRLTPAQIAPIARQFLEALISAHAAGIIHRDLKPENIFILRSKAGRADFVKLIDFGISKFSRPFEGAEHRMTRADAVLGTPCYMSPEQARGASKTDVRSDIYSCGVILYEAVTGRLPFEGTSFNDLMFKIALSDAPSPIAVQPDLDPEFAHIINHATVRDPNRRYSSALEFAQALDEWAAKNGVTDALGFTPAPAESIARQVILRAAPTLNVEDDPPTSPGVEPAGAAPAAAADLRKTGTEESWARSKAEALPQNPRGSRRRTIATASMVGLVLVGLAIAVLARPGSVPAPESASAAAAPHTSAGSFAATPSAAPIALAPSAPSLPSAPDVKEATDAPAPSAAALASTPVHHDPVKAAAGFRPPAPAPSANTAKPKAKSTTVKGFDLGY
jgi:eukaryotic-like serine/threonine-protein kinase